MRSIAATLLPGLLALSGCVDSWGSWQRGGGGCREFRCTWRADEGTIEEISTWHEKAKAYRLAGSPARISRVVDVPAIPGCVEIQLTADVAEDALLELQFDFGNDGSIDARVPAEPGKWTSRTYHVRAPSSARHLRTVIAKQGPGEAAIEHIALVTGGDECAGLPATTLVDGSSCLDDGSCASGYCVLGTCSPCGAGGCAEGSACRADKDCMDGACAAGVCRACAASGSCGKDEGCSTDAQCAGGTCVFGAKPSLVRYPELDGVCGECNGDDDCGGKKCVLGQCSECAADVDCTGDLRCRSTNALDASERKCVPRFDAILPRGALCEVDAECTGGLRCGGAPGRAKRCGFSCRHSSECGAEEACGEPGSVPVNAPSLYELLPSYAKDSASRVRTCYRKYTWKGRDTTPCQVHAQCAVSEYYPVSNTLAMCCEGQCAASGINLTSGSCNHGDNDFFTQFYWGR